MEDSAFSQEFCRFVQSSVISVDAAELLLLLWSQPDVWWEPSALSAELAPAAVVSDIDTARYTGQFHAAGLVAVGPDGRVQYRPATEALAAHMAVLAQAYKERPVTLFRVIYARA